MEEVYSTLKDKMAESKSSSYEALQYLQSFVARKKKSLGKDSTSLAVFHGANLLVQRKANAEAGEVLSWFIDSDQFEVVSCLQRLEELLKKMAPDQAQPLVTCIYDPLHQRVVKGMTKANQKDMHDRLLKLDAIFADVFQKTQLWPNAYKSVLRLGDIKRAANILNDWSKGGFKNEKPLFFARSVLTLMAEKKVELAAEMVKECTPYMDGEDNIDPPRAGGDDSAPLAAWHLAVILSGLASLPPMQRVDKTRLFSVLSNLYLRTLEILDLQLVMLVEKIGKNVFAVQPVVPEGNPMALMQAMMAASAPPRNAPQKQQKKQQMDPKQLAAMLQQYTGK